MHNVIIQQDIFQDTIMRLRATGILSKLQYDAMNPPLARPRPRVRVDQPLSLSQLATLFIIQAIGITFGIVAVIGEICITKWVGQDE